MRKILPVLMGLIAPLGADKALSIPVSDYGKTVDGSRASSACYFMRKLSLIPAGYIRLTFEKSKKRRHIDPTVFCQLVRSLS